MNQAKDVIQNLRVVRILLEPHQWEMNAVRKEIMGAVVRRR
jgi:hypothetical protein